MKKYKLSQNSYEACKGRDDLAIVENAPVPLIANMLTVARLFGYDVSVIVTKGDSRKLKRVEDVADVISRGSRVFRYPIGPSFVEKMVRCAIDVLPEKERR